MYSDNHLILNVNFYSRLHLFQGHGNGVFDRNLIEQDLIRKRIEAFPAELKTALDYGAISFY